MEKDADNLFASLHKWAHGQDENFITDAFVYLLKKFADYDPSALRELLSLLSDGHFDVDSDRIEKISIQSQVITDYGTPDIQINTEDFLWYIEIKVDSVFGDRQIERYRECLKKCNNYTEKLLTAITKYPFYFQDEKSKPDTFCQWHHVIDYLSMLKPKSEVSIFLRDEFSTFLTKRGIAMEKVSWQLPEGVKSFKSLIDMIGEALAGKEIPVHSKSGGWEWQGYYLDDKKFFVGVYFSYPEKLYFNTEVPVTMPENEEPSFGYITQQRWEHYLDLTSENVYFFARSKGNQIQRLEEFIEKCYRYAQTILAN